jgi:hypothetical protein
MKSKRLKVAGLSLASAALGALCLAGPNAQQNKNPSNNPPPMTNWVGYLVFGTEESSDPIARGAYPTADRQIEIGLRSDGVVVWRKAPR